MVAAPEGTVTLLFTDIEGSTRLLRTAGDGYADLLLAHRRLLREAFTAHGGFEVDTEGDAFFVAFASARQAVAAAEAAQRALAAHGWPEGQRVWVRMGVHTGEPRLVDGNYIGLDVHHAARVMAAGHGGQVLLSQSTRDLLDEATNLRDLGEHRLKDLSLPQRLYQLQVDVLPEEFPALKTLGNRPTNLPVQPNPLIGRERELNEVAALLLRDQVRLVTLTGPGGTGKTRLALQAAANVIDEFADGVYFVSLAPARDPAVVIPTIAQSLGLREQPAQPLAETLHEYLKEKAVLLVLDNLEQIVESAPEIAAVLAIAPKTRVLATSREPLRIRGEQLYEVPPLSLPSQTDDLGALERVEAVQLFMGRAQAAEPEFMLSAENASAVRNLVIELDGLPLAIELTAARVRVLSPQAILDRLGERLKLLTGGSRDQDERQQTLRATIQWSYDLLTPEEQTLFARLGVFVGGCRLEAAEAVCVDELEIDVLDGVASLVDKSLVRRRDDADGQPRFWMLETIREYALDSLTHPSKETAEERVAAHMLALGKEAQPELRGNNARAWLLRLDGDHDNLRASLDWLITRRRSEDVSAFLEATWYFWVARGRIREVLPSATAALDLHYADPLQRARALTYVGELIRHSDNDEGARALKEQALPIFLEHGDLRMAAAHLRDLGEIAAAAGDRSEARRLHQESLALRKQIGRPDGIAHALIGVADDELVEGDYDAAKATSLRIVEIARELNDPEYLMHGLTYLGEAEIHLGELREAASHLREALTAASAFGSLEITQTVVSSLARVYALDGQPLRSALLWGAAEAMRERGGFGFGAFVPAAAAEYQVAINAAQAHSATETFSTKWAEGRSLTVSEAIAEALAS